MDAIHKLLFKDVRNNGFLYDDPDIDDAEGDLESEHNDEDTEFDDCKLLAIITVQFSFIIALFIHSNKYYYTIPIKTSIW